MVGETRYALFLQFWSEFACGNFGAGSMRQWASAGRTSMGAPPANSYPRAFGMASF
jgi:hypothetical protein